jgi:hypothetical protein
MATHTDLIYLVVSLLWIVPWFSHAHAHPIHQGDTETVAAPPSDHNFTLLHNEQSYYEAISHRVDHQHIFSRNSESAVRASWSVKASCQTDHLCFAKACDIIGEKGKVNEGIHIGVAVIQGARSSSEADAIPCPNQPVTVSVCFRTAEESSLLFFLPDDHDASKGFVCFAETISYPSSAPAIDGHGCDTHIDLVFLKNTMKLVHVGPYEFFVHIEMQAGAASGPTVTAVSQPAFFVLSRNVSVLVWGDHGGTLKTANEMLLLSGIAPERLFCFLHGWGYYDYALRDTPCTRPQFPAAMGQFLKSMIIHGDTHGVMGTKHSYLNPNSISNFIQWSSEFDVFDVCIPCCQHVSKHTLRFCLSCALMTLFPGHLD